ncbi:hypothetical protein ABT040_38540 [Streptomyces sp. NPDC002688]|uniref:hypothetical protein n=1 Tax=Streptomyces sp. NPDC002688 TaxID=3154423 RepID=UPI0033248DFE
MFDGLHDIDWASMEHAYGSAEEVPALLWALRSPDAGERHRALDRYYGAVHRPGGDRSTGLDPAADHRRRPAHTAGSRCRSAGRWR